MKHFEKNYSETPFAKKCEEFETCYEKIWKKDWTDQAVQIIKHAYCVGISGKEVEKDLCQNNYISIYKNIIIKCRLLEEQASLQQDSAWEEQLKTLKQHYQAELLKTLTATIHDFCMEV